MVVLCGGVKRHVKHQKASMMVGERDARDSRSGKTGQGVCTVVVDGGTAEESVGAE